MGSRFPCHVEPCGHHHLVRRARARARARARRPELGAGAARALLAVLLLDKEEGEGERERQGNETRATRPGYFWAAHGGCHGVAGTWKASESE